MTSNSLNITSRKKSAWKGTVIEIHVPAHIDFKWNHEQSE